MMYLSSIITNPLLWIMLLLFAGGMVSVGAPVVSENFDSPFFPTKVGTKWVYEWSNGGTRTQVITRVKEEKGAKVVEVAEIKESGMIDHIMTVVVSPDGMYLRGTGVTSFDPDLREVKLPYKDGDSWEQEVTIHDKKWKTESKKKWKFMAPAIDEIKVPAGTFKAIRIHAVESSRASKREYTSWYAPGVGLIKKDYVESLTVARPPQKVEYRLKSFTIGKK